MKTITTTMVRDRLDRCLRDLGPTVEAVEATLHTHGVAGLSEEPEQCPVALFVRRYCFRDWKPWPDAPACGAISVSACVSDVSVSVWFGDAEIEVTVIPPGPVSSFIDRYDRGACMRGLYA